MNETSRPEPAIKVEKLKFLIAKITIWDFLNISEATYKAYPADEKSRLLTKCYSELFGKYYGLGNFFLFFCLCLCLSVFFCVLKNFFFFFLGSGFTQIDSSVSQAIQNFGKIMMTKNLVFSDKTVEATLVATKFENGNGKNTTNIWPEHGYFKQQPCDFGLDKENFPENPLSISTRDI